MLVLLSSIYIIFIVYTPVDILRFALHKTVVRALLLGTGTDLFIRVQNGSP